MITITTSPQGDWYTVQHDGNVLTYGHRPTIDDIIFLLDYFKADANITVQEVDE